METKMIKVKAEDRDIYPRLKHIFSNEIENLCHYTTTEVLDILLKNATFRASNIFYLNDFSEYTGGIEKIKSLFNNKKYKTLNDILKEISSDKIKANIGLFSISFSSDSDLLQQWVTYAKESGVCIELDGEVLKNIRIRTIPKKEIKIDDSMTEAEKDKLKKEDINNYDVVYEATDVILRMKYKRKDVKADILYNAFATVFLEENISSEKELLQITEEEVKEKWEKDENRDLARIYLQLVAAFLKNEKFEGEKEIRTVFVCTEKYKSNNPAIIKYFRMKNGILRPYFEVSFVKEKENTNENEGVVFEPMLPVKAIVIGPSGVQQEVFDSVVHRIKYGEINVWKYERWELKRKFELYVKGSIERYKSDHLDVKIDSNGEEYIYSKLACKLKDYSETPDILSVLGAVEQNNKDGEMDKVVEEICKNNFFSKEGIWVKKSITPYIF